MKKNFGDPKCIIPAQDWYARFKMDEGEILDVPLCFWALLDSGSVIGFVATDGVTHPAPSLFENFCGYFHKSELKKRV